MLPATTPGSMLDKALSVAAPEDIYYYGSKTMKKQKIATMQRTNFIQNLASLQGGQSVITLSPAEGMSHVIIGLQLPAAAPGPVGPVYTGCALPRAWAYSAIDFVQWRYGSSSLFQKSGQQLLIETVATAGSQSEANALLNLAGAAQTGAAGDFTGNKLYAYAVIPLPHCGAQSGSETPNPFPSELLSAPIVITVALKNPAAIFATTGSAFALPSAWANAYLQVRQINAVDRGQLMKMDSTYAFPCTFFQQANSVSLSSSEVSQEVVLTGFRSGSCKGVHVWVVDTSDTANPNAFVDVRDLELSYAGNVIHKYNGVSADILDTLYTDVPSYIDNPSLAVVGGAWTSTDAVSSWVHFPLQQRFEQLSAEFTEVSGMGISNGVMNLRLTTPTAKNSYRLYYVPYYSSAIVMHQGQAEYFF